MTSAGALTTTPELEPSSVGAPALMPTIGQAREARRVGRERPVDDHLLLQLGAAEDADGGIGLADRVHRRLQRIERGNEMILAVEQPHRLGEIKHGAVEFDGRHAGERVGTFMDAVTDRAGVAVVIEVPHRDGAVLCDADLIALRPVRIDRRDAHRRCTAHRDRVVAGAAVEADGVLRHAGTAEIP